ncbi:MAG: hypothetical protein JWP68_190 [Modestobacter sp.]|nr:hypothetical protein [Modestobacter sp.]MCW2507042.1 hypothetical protein [Modestobacter sp.]
MGAQAVIRAAEPGDVEVLHRFLVELAEVRWPRLTRRSVPGVGQELAVQGDLHPVPPGCPRRSKSRLTLIALMIPSPNSSWMSCFSAGP